MIIHNWLSVIYIYLRNVKYTRMDVMLYDSVSSLKLRVIYRKTLGIIGGVEVESNSNDILQN